MKKYSTDNKTIILRLFRQIEQELGFHITDYEFGNCYFVFESDKPDTICHFHIKEIPDYLFGLWDVERVNIPYEEVSYKSEFLFFTQHKDNIDKFKPSYSGFLIGLYREEVTENGKIIKTNKWNLYPLCDALMYMYKHKYKTYFHVSICNNYIWNEISGIKAFYIYVKDKFYTIKNKNIKRIKQFYYKIVIKFICKRLKYTNVLFIDKGPEWYPNLRIDIRRKQNISINQYNKDTKILNYLENKFSNVLDINIWEYDISKDLTAEQKLQDLDLQNRFYSLYTDVITNEVVGKLLYYDVEDIKKC